MKALVLRRPWPELVAHGTKTVEGRRWSTRYRGPLLIVAGKTVDPVAWRRLSSLLAGEPGPAGVAVAIVDLVGVHLWGFGDAHAACLTPEDLETYRPTHALEFANARRIEPFPVRGTQGLFEVEVPEILTA